MSNIQGREPTKLLLNPANLLQASNCWDGLMLKYATMAHVVGGAHPPLFDFKYTSGHSGGFAECCSEGVLA